jgi:hypothetical protein
VTCGHFFFAQGPAEGNPRSGTIGSIMELKFRSMIAVTLPFQK